MKKQPSACRIAPVFIQLKIQERIIMITVNGKEISSEEYSRTCSTYMMQSGKQEITKDEKIAVANQLVNARLLLDAGKESDVEVTDDELEENYANFKAQYSSEEEFKAALENVKDTEQSIKEKLKDNILLHKYLSEYFYSKPTVTNQDAENFYAENEKHFVTPDRVQASHILVKDEKAAEEVKSKLDAGGTFEDLAKEYSKCPSAEKGGDLGLFGKGQMVAEFEKAAFSLNVGETAGPVKTEFGYHMIKVTDKKKSEKQSFESVRDNIKAYLAKGIADQLVTEKITELREASEIVIDEDSL